MFISETIDLLIKLKNLKIKIFKKIIPVIILYYPYHIFIHRSWFSLVRKEKKELGNYR